MNTNDYLDKERDIQRRFKESVLNDYFEIRFNERRKIASSYAEFDIILFKNDIPYSIVEIKMSLNAATLSNAKHHISEALQLTHCRFGIITDDSKFLIIDATNSNQQYEELDFDQIVQRLIKPNVIPQKSGEIEDIKKSLEICLNANQILSICNEIKYDESQGFYTFETSDKEKKFFIQIFGNLDVGIPVYRYTSLETLFVMLNNGTYRMNGIVGMNDKSEVDYFDKNSNIKKSGSSIRELNKTYLSSCSLLKDDLTMWRLYGDDAKGVCLAFEIVPDEKRYENFFLAPVNYEEKDHSHKALEMLKGLSDIQVRFAELDKWKHFFKPYEYAVEKEIRLMFFDNEKYNNGVTNRDWVKTRSHSIVNPIVDFKLNAPSFPLQLKSILLGPKMPERDTNKSQLEDIISLKGYSISVAPSGIDNYR